MLAAILIKCMIIKTRLSEKDYIRASFALFYSKFWVKFITLVGVLGLIVSVIAIFVQLQPQNSSPITIAIIFLFGLPVMTYFSAKRNYSSMARISEPIEYRFTDDNLEVKGESFSSQYTWDKIYKITQTKNWILIWHSRQIANPIPKSDIWQAEYDDLKRLLSKHGIKNNL